MSVSLSNQTELLAETNVAFNDVVHVSNSVPEHEGAFNTHTECETGVDLRIDSVCSENVGVHHAATTDFNPAGAALLLWEPNIEFGAGLSERKNDGRRRAFASGPNIA